MHLKQRYNNFTYRPLPQQSSFRGQQLRRADFCNMAVLESVQHTIFVHNEQFIGFSVKTLYQMHNTNSSEWLLTVPNFTIDYVTP